MTHWTMVAACAFSVLPGVLAAQQQALTPPADAAAVERGRQVHVKECGFCHGSNARGGSSGLDLTRSELVQTDEQGRQIGAFLRTGRPDKGMPKFDLTDAQVSDLAAFLHAAIYENSNRRLYKILDILVGDAKRGEAYFAANCGSCHKADGDMKGIGAKYDPVGLQQRMLMPRGGRRGPGPGGRPNPPYMEPTAIKAAVTLASGETVRGALLGVTDFQVVIWDPQTNKLRSFLRHDGVPAVELTDPLQAHIDLWKRWTDADMHDVTAFLAGLK